jgi:eukaryotic-like serine/threonine-protein kinase
MARLSHPNVVSVYELGTIGERVFIAMEYVSGRTLTEWLREKERAAREVLEVFIRAGKGLAAAHAAGLVHRDFKPDNVLIGADGQVKVLDFGLARAAEPRENEPTLPPWLEARGPSPPRTLQARLTRTGALLGTPAYMAPEQLLGKPTDARTDQFSFCVALYEALYRERPFEGDSAETLALKIAKGQVKEPPKSGHVARWIRQILLRALKANPDERYPSMEPLLEQLSKDPRAFRRRALAIASAILALAAIATSSWLVTYRNSQLCKGGEQKLLGVWDRERKRAVEASFLATGASFATDAFAYVDRTVDKYAQTWIRVHTDACKATRLRGEQSEELLDLRMQCLSQRWSELKALVDLFAVADRKLVERSAQAAEALSPLDNCNNAEALKAPIKPAADPATRAKVEEMRKSLAKATALFGAGKYSEGLPLATEFVDRAKAIHYRPMEAEALHLLGRFQYSTGDYRSAEQSVSAAILAGEAGRHDPILAQAWTTLVLIGIKQDKYQQSHEWADHAFAAIERVGSSERFLASLFDALGTLFERQGQYEQALVNYRRGLELSEKVFGVEHTDTASLLGNIGIVLGHLGHRDEALDHTRRALAIREKVLGPTHPDIAYLMNDLGIWLQQQGKYEEARQLFERALAIKKDALGASHPDVASGLNSLGVIYGRLGQYDEALTHFKQSFAIIEKALGPAHSQAGRSLVNIGFGYSLKGNHEQALESYRRALTILEAALGREHPDLARPLTGIGREYVELHVPQKAIVSLERSLSLAEKNSLDSVFLAHTRFALARALSDLGRELKRARQLATLARAAYAADGEGSKRELAKVDLWLHDRWPELAHTP